MGKGWSIWFRSWTAFGMACLCLALLMWGPAALAAVILIVVMCSVLVMLLARQDRPDAFTAPPRANILGLIRPAGLVALAVVSVGVLAVAAPSVMLLAMPLTVVTTPPALAMLSRSLGRGAPRDTVAPDRLTSSGVDPVRSVRSLTDADLCAAWRRSFADLLRATTPLETARIATLRQSYLDEMEVRNAGALSAWLESGARASSGPERFLVRPDPESEGPAHAA